MPAAQSTEIRIPFATLLKVAAFALLVICVIKLWPVIVMVFVATLIAVVIDPAVAWLEKHHVRRGFGIALAAIILFGILAAFAFVILPAVASQVSDLVNQFPQIAHRLGSMFPPVAPLLNHWAARVKRPPSAKEMEALLVRGSSAGLYAVEGITMVILVLVLAIYLLIEGRRAIDVFHLTRSGQKLTPSQQEEMTENLQRVLEGRL